jgi:hypothetical protein
MKIVRIWKMHVKESGFGVVLGLSYLISLSFQVRPMVFFFVSRQHDGQD